MDDTINLQEIVKVIWNRFILIISAVILSVSIMGVVSYYFLTPIYEASTQILINQKNNEQSQFNTTDIQTNLQLINTYNVIIKSQAILSKVIANLDLNTTPAELNLLLSVNSEQNSQVVNVSVQDSDSRRAVEIANTTAEVFQEEIQTLMNVDNVYILSPALHSNNPSPVKPNLAVNLAIAGVIGLMIGLGIAYLLEFLDTTVKTEREIEEFIVLPILGHVSPISDKEIKGTKEIVSRRKKGLTYV